MNGHTEDLFVQYMGPWDLVNESLHAYNLKGWAISEWNRTEDGTVVHLVRWVEDKEETKDERKET